jgi:ribose/xylose/arabinose/galactoside ABC-type transport system permease subunit
MSATELSEHSCNHERLTDVAPVCKLFMVAHVFNVRWRRHGMKRTTVTFNRPTIISMFLGVALVLGFGLRKTILGRWLYWIGTNINAARITGLPTRGASFAAYAISGMCAGVAGIMNTAALSSARPGMGPDTQILCCTDLQLKLPI